MEAIKGRGLAGAQLTTSGAGEEGDMDQEPRLYREGTSKLQGGGRSGNLFSCLSVSLSFHLSFGCVDLAFALEGQLEFVLLCPHNHRYRKR